MTALAEILFHDLDGNTIARIWFKDAKYPRLGTTDWVEEVDGDSEDDSGEGVGDQGREVGYVRSDGVYGGDDRYVHPRGSRSGARWRYRLGHRSRPVMNPFSYCPDCGKKGVQFHFAKVVAGEDGYGCRYCDFWFFTSGDRMNVDRDNESRWRDYNGEIARTRGVPNPIEVTT